MKSGIFLLAVITITPVMSAAQTARTVDIDEMRSRIAQLQVMEQALEEAVARGARAVEQQLPVVMPGMVFVGTIQARAFVLDDYGVFFDVEFPFMRGSLLWSIEMLNQMEGGIFTVFQGMRQRLKAMPDGPAQVAYGRALAEFEAQFQQFTPTVPGGPPNATETAHADPVVQFDPQATYLDALSTEFVHVLKAHGRATGLADDEWITIAARDARGRVDPRRVPGARSTLILRVEGRDLAAIETGRMSTADVKALIQIR